MPRGEPVFRLKKFANLNVYGSTSSRQASSSPPFGASNIYELSRFVRLSRGGDLYKKVRATRRPESN